MTKHIFQNLLLLVGLVVLIVAFHIFSVNTLKGYVDDLCEQGENMIDMVNEEQYEEAIVEAKKLKKQWEKNGRKLCFFVDHDDVETIGHMIAKVQSDFREETWSLAVTEMEEIMAKAKDMYSKGIFKKSAVDYFGRSHKQS